MGALIGAADHRQIRPHSAELLIYERPGPSPIEREIGEESRSIRSFALLPHEMKNVRVVRDRRRGDIVGDQPSQMASRNRQSSERFFQARRPRHRDALLASGAEALDALGKCHRVKAVDRCGLYVRLVHGSPFMPGRVLQVLA